MKLLGRRVDRAGRRRAVFLASNSPKSDCKGDIDAALNYAERLPTEGEAALVDDRDNVPVFGKP
jgi:hypothetical protein